MLGEAQEVGKVSCELRLTVKFEDIGTVPSEVRVHSDSDWAGCLRTFVKAASGGIGVQSLAHDRGLELSLVVVVDSSAAVEMVSQSGVGRVRHLDVKDLWVQERVKRGFLTIVRVPGDSNPADVATKPLAVAELQDKISLVNAHIVARMPRWADMNE